MKTFPAETKNRNAGSSEQKNIKGPISRRHFLTAGTAAIAVPLIIPRYVLGGTGRQSPSDKLRIAGVGLNMGRNYLEGCKDEEIVALCDLDHDFAAKTFEKWPKARRYHDFRKMLDKEANQIDALIVATPDHTHTIILMAAIELNKHVYCAKPVTHSIGEARKVKKAVLENPQLITKASVQSSGTGMARSSTELLSANAIGPVTEVHVWCNHPIYPASLTRPEEVHKLPRGMDWDLWIGPAPYRPFNKAYHPWMWRPWWDFGSGTVGDMCCHSFHFYFDELQLQAPTTIYGTGSFHHDGIVHKVETPECQSRANMITWEYPSRGDLPPVSVHWYDGGMKPHRPVELDHELPMPSSGVLFVGEKGKLLTGYGGGSPYKDRGNEGGLLLPEKKFTGYQDPPQTLRRVEEHYKEWTTACKTGEKTVCPIEYGCEMTEVGLLGALALRTKKLLEWDAEVMQVTNQGIDVSMLVKPPYRKGWEI
jgi:predicted dehydrogenase